MKEGPQAMDGSVLRIGIASLDELAALSGRSTGNLSRTLRSMALHRIVALDRGPGCRLVPRVLRHLPKDLPQGFLPRSYKEQKSSLLVVRSARRFLLCVLCDCSL